MSDLQLAGVNTFLPKEHGADITTTIELIRSTEEEKGQQIANVEAFAPTAICWSPLPRAGVVAPKARVRVASRENCHAYSKPRATAKTCSRS